MLAGFDLYERFFGKERRLYDATTGLYYNLNRYYHPRLGRYIEPDPVKLKGGQNPYIYADNNPVMNIDPSGLNFLRFLPIIGDILDVLAMADGEPPGAAIAKNTVKRTSKVAKSKAEHQTAEEAADAAYASGKRSGAAAELRVGDKVFTGVSGETVPHAPEVTAALMGTPGNRRAPWHGGCAEVVCFDKAFNAGVDPAGGTIRAVNIGVSGNGHNTPKALCSSCDDISTTFGVKKK